MCESDGKSQVIRGLVLEGGGAKGAYAFGCLQALKNAGITFDSIAGSSVGALNAALWSANRLDNGEAFWRSLSLRSICKPRFKFLIYLLFPFHLLSVTTDSNMRFQSTKGVLHIIGRRVLMFLFTLWGAIVAFGIALVFGNSSEHSMSFWDGFKRIFEIFSFRRIPAEMPLWLGIGINIFFISILLYSAIFIFLKVVPPIGSLIWRHLRLTLFDTLPLRNLIGFAFSGSKLAIPTYVTLSKCELAFDPDKPSISYFIPFGNGPALWKPFASEIQIPIYEKLSDSQSNQFTDLLVATTALPLGLFPSVQLDGKDYFDGGVSDNLPLWPLLNIENCNEVWIVRLQPLEHENDLVNHWQKVDRKIRVPKLSIDDARSMFEAIRGKSPHSQFEKSSIEPPVNIPFHQFPNKVRLITIAPKKKLGKFFSGTMNFKAKYAQRLIALGKADAERIISNMSFL
ncbi:MAG TPA: patatin-like phospholipase family protein [Melioribacteraceae bacterium]|nr:patatin-like phospholipase family protein [Melioribacteraceae bacterium]